MDRALASGASDCGSTPHRCTKGFMENILNITSRKEFRKWLEENSSSEVECWIAIKRAKPQDDGTLYYLDAVEEALCFGWIDSTLKSVDGKSLQRSSKRAPNSPWTEKNKERVRRLEKLNLMTDKGREVLPDMDVTHFEIDKDVASALKAAKVYSKFKTFPPLYQRVRAYNVAFYKKLDYEKYEAALSRLIEQTKLGKMYGEWTDYGRLIDY